MAWGWPAFVQHSSAAPPSTREEANQPVFASRFKLLLAPDADDTEFSGLGVRELVSKYLEKLGGVALDHIRQQLGAHIRPLDVQWCITVRLAHPRARCASCALMLGPLAGSCRLGRGRKGDDGRLHGGLGPCRVSRPD